MKEIISLIERAKKYLNSSGILLDEGDYESSVSRAYYAMFYVAEAVLLTKGLSFSSHKREFNRAFEKRQLGDYDYTFVISQDEAKEILDKSRDFVENLV